MNEHEILQSFWHNSDGTWTPWSAPGLGRVKTFSCKRSELDEVRRERFPDFHYALIAAISG